jgi:GT2 family glycosyltransferase
VTKQSTARVVVNILNYNTERYLASCVRAIERQTYGNLVLMITDNASPGGGCNFIREKFPHVPLRSNSRNLGFAGAHNEIIADGGFDYYLPLNPDVELKPNFVEMMVSALESEPVIGAVNGKLLFMTNDGQETDFIYSAGHECNRARRPSNRGYKQKDSREFSEPAWIFGVNGAAPLYKRAFLESVKMSSGYFDSSFFMYGEDFDLGWRGINLGFRFLYEPRAVAYHRGFGSGGLSTPQVQREYERNRLVTIYKNERFASIAMDMPFVLAHEVMSIAFYAATDPRRVSEYFRALGEFVRMAPAKRAERAAIMARATVAAGEVRKYCRSPWLTTLIKRQFGHRVVPPAATGLTVSTSVTTDVASQSRMGRTS